MVRSNLTTPKFKLAPKRRRSISRLLFKALALANLGAVQKLEADIYAVEGNHARYIVKKNGLGVLECECPGFKRSQLCSHVIAVMIFEARDRLNANQ